MATDEEVLMMIEVEMLSARGTGYVDAHLLAATRITVDTTLWTMDRRLNDVAKQFGAAFSS